MDIAYCEEFNEIVCGIELTEMEISEITRLSFFCPECGARQLPASYDPKNKKIPYFRTFPKGDDHDLDCDYHKNNNLKKKKKLITAESDQEFPFRVPNKLILVSSNIKKVGGTPIKKRVREMQKMYSTSSLRPICQTYLCYPDDRKIMPLSIPTVSGKTYLECFRILRNDMNNSLDKVLYNLIDWKNLKQDILINYADNLNEVKNKLVFTVLKSSKKIKVNCETWTDKQLKSLLWEIDDAIDSALSDYFLFKKLWIDNNPDKDIDKLPPFMNSKKVRLFFIGKKDENNDDIFIVDNRRLITVFYY